MLTHHLVDFAHIALTPLPRNLVHLERQPIVQVGPLAVELEELGQTHRGSQTSPYQYSLGVSLEELYQRVEHELLLVPFVLVLYLLGQGVGLE